MVLTMGDTEGGIIGKSPVPSGETSMGCSPMYLFSIPGLLRIINIILGAACMGLWIPGFDHEFLGEKTNHNTGDTQRGYGYGFKKETLNEFVLAAIIMSLGASIVLLIMLVLVNHASVDWNRFNKLAHAFLGVYTWIAGVCAIFGVWYFQENCCHVGMSWSGLIGITYNIQSGEGYNRHCHCYVSRYLAHNEQETATDTLLWNALSNPDPTGWDHRWVWAAHHIYIHVAAIFLLFLNSGVYFGAAFVSKNKK